MHLTPRIAVLSLKTTFKTSIPLLSVVVILIRKLLTYRYDMIFFAFYRNATFPKNFNLNRIKGLNSRNAACDINARVL